MLLTKHLFFFHQKQPPNCPPVSTAQRRQPLAYKLLRLCEMKHSSICQNKRENGRISYDISAGFDTTLTNIAPSGKVENNGWNHRSLSDRLKGLSLYIFTLFLCTDLLSWTAKRSDLCHWLSDSTCLIGDKGYRQEPTSAHSVGHTTKTRAMMVVTKTK